MSERLSRGGQVPPASKVDRLRDLLAGPSPVRAVGAHDGLTAKLVEQAGFDAVWASSFEISASHGLPDASLVTMTQYLDAATAMDEVTDIPVIADCDTGFGGPMNVAYAVQRYARIGIAAMCIEDKLFPKINSFADIAQDLLPAEDFALKIKAAREALGDEDMVLIARTESLIAGHGLEEALGRGRLYASAGADAVLVHSKSRRPDEVLEFASKWDVDVPLVAVPTTYGTVSEQELHESGFRLVIYANQGLRAAVRGVQEVLRELNAAGTARSVDERIASMSEVFALQGMPSGYRTTP
ncbi:isocitrate lyase/phosphoenolpyruvate mutase family protein [Streptomyces sp. ISL-10]|uniref:isocitrate lyase/phosphoenolpyruvate mutase family protein n=1 Tax=Streptomyces sp. ISL-10 TaxID=2819172 RepID=UPI001BE990D5|nr:isocitrate lyase/phosphoenolpyruvate mutase family protein [Streptomyces sp. ISL-10]MBT2363963.1 isocitrate lyase/phosphoenolpyruvate mutase family protein [Streptomyces sp. ISL-10]